ncbi:MAG: YraN family protein [Desulfuromonas sp.]|nr:YraN family protein [Desulfuromonas thiophila]MDY0397420.1 YraN family protein [Desulfuromonas thiophila]
MSHQRLALGRWGEDYAAAYLQRRLFRILARNFRTRCGEIDLIARRGRLLVFVEVKTRSSTNYGLGQEAVTARKQQQIVRVAHQYLQSHDCDGLNPRFDVIVVCLEGGQPRLEHLTDAFGV